MKLEVAVSSLIESMSHLKKLTVQMLEELPEDSKDQGNVVLTGLCVMCCGLISYSVCCRQ